LNKIFIELSPPHHILTYF